MPYAMHVNSELSNDETSRYISTLPKGSSHAVVTTVACRAFPIGENPWGMDRGHVVELQGDRYLVLGQMDNVVQLARLGDVHHSKELRRLSVSELEKMDQDGNLVVYDQARSQQALEEKIGPRPDK